MIFSHPHNGATELLIEPFGLLEGAGAAEAVQRGLALPLMGGPTAFTLARLHDGHATLVRASDIPERFHAALARVTAPPSSAGLPSGPLVMAIINATPDSFSDPGLHADPDRATEAGRRFIAEGADILDIGGESTRPGAIPPGTDEEIRRVLPIFQNLRGQALLSVDTRRAPVMLAALDAGASLINDVSGLTYDPDAVTLLARHSGPIILMHSRGTPATMQSLATYGDVILDTVRELDARIEAAIAGGIARTRIIVDPGIGFAKTAAQNLELLHRLPILANLGGRILLGVSRKSIIGRLADEPSASKRTPGSLAAIADALKLPGLIVRTHDVEATVQFIKVHRVQGLSP